MKELLRNHPLRHAKTRIPSRPGQRLRRDRRLDEGACPSDDRLAHDDPIVRFKALLDEAIALPRDLLPEPTAFALGTVDTAGSRASASCCSRASTSADSCSTRTTRAAKGRELLATKRAALCFHWQLLEVQVRVEGTVDVVTDAEADAYFASRARGSQIGAWASMQSEPMPTAILDERVAEVERRFAGAACRGRRTGRDSASSRGDRVLEGDAEPPARPDRLPAGRRLVVGRAALPVTDFATAAARGHFPQPRAGYFLPHGYTYRRDHTG